MALGDLSILGAFNQARDQSMKEGTNNLANVGALQGILAKVEEAKKEQAYRGELAGATTPEAQARVAMKYGKPSDVMAHFDRVAKGDQTKQLAMQNLQQKVATEARHAYEFAQTLPLKERGVAVQEINSRANILMKEGSLRIQKGNLDYNVGGDTSSIMDVISQLRSQATAPSGAVPAQAGPVALPAGVPETDRAAYLSARGGVPATVERQVAPDEAARMSLMGGAAAPVAQPTAVPEQPIMPAQPNNLDARDLGAMSRGAVLPSATPAPVAAPVAASAAPQMPQFTGPPAEINRRQNMWRAAQAKGGESGGKASETVVTAIKEGRMQMPTGFALRSPYWQDVVERVSKADPKFDASKYGARAAARRTFASGPEARNVTALNTVIGHLGTLDEAAQALHNGDIRVFNSVANRLATETGDPRVQNFDTAKQAVAEETMRVFRQVGASEMEARQWGERIQSSGSPAQLRGVIGTLGKLLESRVDAIGAQFERSVNQQGNPASVDPANRKSLDRLIDQGKGATWDAAKERRYQELKARQGGS